jgi:hypothetical protein
VPERDERAFESTLLGHAVQLPDQLGALSEPGRAERMVVREHAPRPIHPRPAVPHLIAADQLAAALAGLAELEILRSC